MSGCFRIEGLTYSYGSQPALDRVDLELRLGELTAIVGPNGAGKSTLLSVLAGVRTEYQGRCTFDGRELADWDRRALARRVGFIPQSLRLEFPFTAEQVVFMGRTPHCRGLFESEADREAVRRAMKLTDVERFAGRLFGQLSGGERQRVVLASALAQEPEVLLLDEPTTFLDLKHQIELYELLRELARQGKSVIAVTHDLNLASTYSDRLTVMACGQVAADGSPQEVLRAGMVEQVFGAKVQILQTAAGRPWAVYG